MRKAPLTTCAPDRRPRVAVALAIAWRGCGPPSGRFIKSPMKYGAGRRRSDLDRAVVERANADRVGVTFVAPQVVVLAVLQDASRSDDGPGPLAVQDALGAEA